MPNWNQLKHPFRNALIDAFSLDSLEAILQYHCHRRLDQLTGCTATLSKAVDNVIGNAVLNGWLDQLATGALAANDSHSPPPADGRCLHYGRHQSGEPGILPGIGRNGLAA